MVEKFVSWLLAFLGIRRYDIGRRGDVYLTRWDLFGSRHCSDRPKLFLHLFHRGDYEAALHNHPWDFWSLILAGGYWEWTYWYTTRDGVHRNERKWHGPLSLLVRHAGWRHRVELPPGRRCWTLVWAGPKVQSWGFFCASGFVGWRTFIGREEAGQAGCGEV